MRETVSALAMVLIVACSPSAKSADAPVQQGTSRTAAKVHPPTVDLSTPDRALKSYWAATDSLRGAALQEAVVLRQAYRASHDARLDSAKSRILAGDAKTEFMRQLGDPEGTAQRYAREIIEVKNESETRAVVLARIRNITPVPAGREVYEPETVRDGTVYRYVFERDAEGWKLTQAYNRYSYSSDWRPYFDAALGKEFRLTAP